ncbi:hypothetical protein KKG46_01220 [Patescibacteria group bacterium]|nr:hypothetical protein [Patescibacteria group bacterium]
MTRGLSMARKQTQTNPWIDAIKFNKRKKLGKLDGLLFENQKQTLLFLAAMYSVARGSTEFTPKQRQQYQDLIRQVRASALHSDLEKFSDIIHTIWHSGWQTAKRINCFLIILGTSADDPIERGEAMLVHLLDALDLYRTTTSMADVSASLVMALGYTIAYTSYDGRGSYTWLYAITSIKKNNSVEVFGRMCDVFYAGIGGVVKAVPLSQWDAGKFIIDFGQDYTTWRLPVPDQLVGWFYQQFNLARIQVLENQRQANWIIDLFKADPDFYRNLYEEMWLSMICEPVRALRPDGLDSVEIKHPALTSLGYRKLILFPEPIFPHFRARYIRKPSYGGEQVIEMVLQPTDLQVATLVESKEFQAMCPPRLLYMDKILAFFAVRAMYYIVMDVIPHAFGSNRNGNSGGLPAIVRPIFRRLPQGHNASPEARARALKCFRTEPLPGFTFVRGYQRGDDPNSGEPIFALRDSDLPMPQHN